jgi:glycerol-3-phosphate dehydrogenase
MVYYDAQVDDARYALTVARTAAAHRAVIGTRLSAVGLLRSADGRGPVTGARICDEETGRVFDVSAEAVVVCAGVWTDQVHELAGVRAGYRVRMSKGVHIVVPRAAVDANTGMIVRTDKSVLFFIPWADHWIVGTTDTDFAGDRAEPAATEADISYILAAANRVLARPLTRADVIAVYAGLRPLIDPGASGANGSKPTTKLSREHVVDVPVPGLASIAGGKFTTYRLMARDVVDAAVAGFGRPVPGSVTDQVPLLGADGLAAVQPAAGRLAEDYHVPRAAVEHLLGRYGTLAVDVLDLIRADSALARPLVPGHPYLRAEVAYAVVCEEALHVEDVLVRRTRLFMESADSGVSAAAEVAAIMGRLLGWSRRRRAAETRRYLDLVEAERAQPAMDSVPSPGLALVVAR